PPEPTTPTEILGSTRFYPYFKDCIGVIDGMHIPAHVIAKDQPRFRNRRGVLTQNAAVEVSEPDDQPEASSTSMAQEQAAFLVRHSIAATMWNNFINEWDAW
ncbi:hypothetical protein MKW92_044751, partial [Papaver armeniacum]